MKNTPGSSPIIIVDDVQEDLVLVERILRQCEILNPIRRFSSGAECRAYFDSLQLDRHRHGNPPPALVLLDLAAGSNRFLEVLAFLRRSGIFERVPVVMLSGIQDMNAINEGFRLGVREFLIKPIVTDEIVRLINTLPGILIEETAKGFVLHSEQPIVMEANTFSRKRQSAIPPRLGL